MKNRTTVKAGVIGWPISHSMSPRLHGYWLEHYKINGIYDPLAVCPDDFVEYMKTLADRGLSGVNITVPHKQTAFACIDKIDDNAKRIGAVNTVIVQADGTLEGRNTDSFGFIENLRSSATSWKPGHGPVVVLGAGGAARAVCAALIDFGVPELRLVNRTTSRADNLAEHIGGAIRVLPWRQRGDALEDATLLVNATTLGMVGKPSLDLDLKKLPERAVVNDIVYTPLKTSLLETAARRGNPVVDGLGMLLHQGRPGFAAWFGVDPEVTAELRNFMTRD